MLLFNRQLDAQEALEHNLVAEIFPHDKFYSTVWKRLKQYAELPPQVHQNTV